MNHIELFAGCGGLSLGLDEAGFELILANELSPMAAETFAYNFYGEDLEELANQNQMPAHTFWINSKNDSLKPRLRENPFEFPAYGTEGYSDLTEDWEVLYGNLVVGSIIELNRLLDENPILVDHLRNTFGHNGGLDLVSGGPPCQGFSMAGKREKNNDKNTLPWEFAKFVEHTQPKIALLENVTGILRPFKDDNGNRFYAWYEVAKVFASIGYVPLCLHVNARQAGVAQNRPRFIMIAVKYDHLIDLNEVLDEASLSLFEQPLAFYNHVQSMDVNQYANLPIRLLDYIDATKPAGLQQFVNTFLHPLVENENEVSVQAALDDLKIHNPTQPSTFIQQLNQTFTRLAEQPATLNHDFRNNSPLVKRRFRLYQVLQQVDDRRVNNAVFSILKGHTDVLPVDIWETLSEFEYLHENQELHTFNEQHDFEHYLQAHPTKKQTQKALIANSPAPAALSIPDDACHYDEHELRVLTVREMARIQSFPDNFVFRSKITTGGQMRKFEVPQYTQVGNAVPPILGFKLGQAIAALLPDA
ncbi:DNA cytosine methyltransferase [Photobacterium leiognathi]|uniref:DNA cytosine methyltransferase n=1 Tax=Photobacterium leiognathi TaxID=553611 RepID=UPI0029815C21|nr:DNA cytosine methyltransferase [Photobacterium leiognathi]